MIKTNNTFEKTDLIIDSKNNRRMITFSGIQGDDYEPTNPASTI
ncbi:hypothetical protein SOASR032_01910 [Pragia fontium]|uniref:Uncharacterized protein n=1 Tax=Pragia fontium TaxID=82985 RepID=A0ABQ5LDC6_9GAMM|nr:hypothetical protein SOASR032_01910 [Pragia fontium]